MAQGALCPKFESESLNLFRPERPSRDTRVELDATQVGPRSPTTGGRCAAPCASAAGHLGRRFNRGIPRYVLRMPDRQASHDS